MEKKVDEIIDFIFPPGIIVLPKKDLTKTLLT